LISDRSVSTFNPTNAGNDRYYICYEQVAKSDSPFFLFDENKPTWKSHTTLPHSLTAALLNSARPVPIGGAVCDPFGGTGTTWFEAKRLAIDAAVRCSDLSDAALLLTSDNLQFFLMSSNDLRNLSEVMRKICEAVKEDKKGALDKDLPQASFQFLPESKDLKGAGPYLYAVSLLNELRDKQPYEDQEFFLSADFCRRIEQLAPITRYIFYVVLRAELRYQGGYKRKSVKFEKAFCDSLDELVGQIEQFAELKEGVAAGAPDSRGKSFVVSDGTYSQAILPALVFQSGATSRSLLASEVFTADARKLPKDTYDVILCDPPYGSNTNEDQADLADLYSDFFDAALLSLREGGHLILSVPETSYTGRELPYCTRANLITNQVLTKADSLGKYAFVPAKSVPARIFGPPYYWESERALRRVILHFRISTTPEHRRHVDDVQQGVAPDVPAATSRHQGRG
jgi:tRNA G10  N-methylase Trm11